MSEDVSRVVGAKSPSGVTIAGKQCVVRPLKLKQLGELERDCLARYKREYLQTFAQNADLLPDGKKILMEKMDEVARWDMSDLPPKWVYSHQSIRVTPKLRQWIENELEISDLDEDLRVKRLAAAMLDAGSLTDEKYTELTGSEPRKSKTGYVNWWITGDYEGMISMAWICFRDSGVTRDEVSNEMDSRMETLVSLTREIEALSAPGNG